MNLESSRITVRVTALGSVRCSVCSFARTPSMTATVFSPIARRMSSTTAGVPSASHAAVVGRWNVSSA